MKNFTLVLYADDDAGHSNFITLQFFLELGTLRPEHLREMIWLEPGKGALYFEVLGKSEASPEAIAARNAKLDELPEPMRTLLRKAFPLETKPPADQREFNKRIDQATKLTDLLK